MNGHIQGDEEGQFTYIGPNVESVIDYGIANEEAMGKIRSFTIADRIESDHQPLVIELENISKKTETVKEKSRIDWPEEGKINLKKSGRRRRNTKRSLDIRNKRSSRQTYKNNKQCLERKRLSSKVEKRHHQPNTQKRRQRRNQKLQRYNPP